MTKEQLRNALGLIDGEHAWRAEVWRLEGDRVAEPADATEFLADLKAAAAGLLLEVLEIPGGGVALVHRGGWPFDLEPFAGDPAGRFESDLLPRGSGDEVLRDLAQTFRATSDHALVIRELDDPSLVVPRED